MRVYLLVKIIQPRSCWSSLRTSLPVSELPRQRTSPNLCVHRDVYKKTQSLMCYFEGLLEISKGQYAESEGVWMVTLSFTVDGLHWD